MNTLLSGTLTPNHLLVRTGRKRRTISLHRAGPPHNNTLGCSRKLKLAEADQ